jgi:hypothetical protein
MHLSDFELFPVDWILRLEMNFVFEVLGQTQVVFINVESILVFAQNV